MSTKLVQQELAATKLRILVFGPALTPRSRNRITSTFQRKRREIRDALVKDGHTVLFAEEIVRPGLPAPMNNPMWQEVLIMRDVDFIIVLVASPGAIYESALIAREQALMIKTQFFLLDQHRNGFVAKSLRLTARLGARVHSKSLRAVGNCHLLGTVMTAVRAIQMGKTFLF